MCGRFALYATEETILLHFGLRQGFSMRPRYNIAPTQTIPIVCWKKTHIDFARWGFLPTFVKRMEDKLPIGYMNARLETVLEKPAFKRAALMQRCLIPANGYYEWKVLQGKKQPYFFYLKTHSLFAFAGIFSEFTWKGLSLLTCSILTQAASPALSEVHGRMPVILRPTQYTDWLSNALPLEALSACPEAREGHPVSRAVNHASCEGATCIHPL